MLYDVDLNGSRKRWLEQTGHPVSEFDYALFDDGIKLKMDTGVLSCQEIPGAINHAVGTALTEEIFALIWNPGISPRPRSMALVSQFGDQLTTGVISNTDPFHGAFAQSHPVLSTVVDSWTYSFRSRVMKPDKRIFEEALKTTGTQPQSAIFVDDLTENVQAAQDMGMAGVVFTSPEETASIIGEWLSGRVRTP